MNKTSTVRALMDPQKKKKVTQILKRMGINHSEAINIFYSLIEENQGFPFELKLPENKEKPGIDPAIIAQLKESMQQNKKLGELLAK